VRSKRDMALRTQAAQKATGAVQRQGARTTRVVSCVHVRAASHTARARPRLASSVRLDAGYVGSKPPAVDWTYWMHSA
jgi:hypothetical protein